MAYPGSVKLFLFVLLAACGGSSDGPDAPAADAFAPDAFVPVHVEDGTPTRRTCTSQFGSALTPAFGRLDGLLVAIVPPGGGPCNADSDHVHLQVLANGATYDIAITVADTDTGAEDVHTTTIDHALVGPAWAEGWHTGVLVDYVSIGVHSAALPLRTKAQLVSDLMASLATANHVSVFATGYGTDGAHLVHRNGQGHDGLLVTEPLSNPAHARLFSFTSQAF